MSVLNITWFASVIHMPGMIAPVAVWPPISAEEVTFTGTLGTSEAAPANAHYARLNCDAKCRIKITNASAITASTGTRMAADAVEWIGAYPGMTISAIASTL